MTKATGVAAVASTLTGATSARTADADVAARSGPMRTTRFVVELELADGSVGGFSAVDLPDVTTATSEYREGNDVGSNRELPGQPEYDDLTLTRGLHGGDLSLWNWRKKVMDGKLEEAKKNLAVVVLDRQNQPQARVEFEGAWPTEYSPPQLDATAVGGDAAMGQEELTIAYDRYRRTQ